MVGNGRVLCLWLMMDLLVVPCGEYYICEWWAWYGEEPFPKMNDLVAFRSSCLLFLSRGCHNETCEIKSFVTPPPLPTFPLLALIPEVKI